MEHTVCILLIIIIIIIYFCSSDPKDGNSPQDVEHVIINTRNTLQYIMQCGTYKFTILLHEKDQQRSRINK